MEAFQGGSPVTTLSTRGCRSVFFNFLTDSGMPKLFIGKVCRTPGRKHKMRAVSFRSQQIGAIAHLWWFVLSPEANAKMSKTIFVATKFCSCGDVSRITSSAYRKILSWIPAEPNGVSVSLISALLINAFRASIASTNSNGESGSPCLNPLAWQIRRPRDPFRMIFVLAVDSMTEIQFVHRFEKPMCPNSCKRKVQSRESKALAMSILYRALGIFFYVTILQLIGRPWSSHESSDLWWTHFDYCAPESAWREQSDVLAPWWTTWQNCVWD